jgi:hypothetical protein
VFDEGFSLNKLTKPYHHINPYGLFELDMTKRLVIDPASALRVSILDRKRVFTAK